MPKKAEEAKIIEHHGDCKGTHVVEYQDSGGKRWHCPVCGFWRVSK